MLSFHPTKSNNISQITSIEAADASWICPYTAEEHLQCIQHPDEEHISIWEQDTNDLIGFILLKGLKNPNRTLEFRRIVIKKKGKGYGRKSIQWVKNYCFKKLKFHRLWLDVFTDNKRAQHLYTSEGFKVEGTIRESVRTPEGYRSLFLMSILEGEYFS